MRHRQPGAVLLAAVTLLAARSATAEEGAASAVAVTDGLIVRGNTILAPGVYRVNDAGSDGVIQIAADNVTLDGSGVVIAGQGFHGYGIRVNGHSGVTLRNFTIHGFDFGILIENASNVLIENNDVSGNRKDTQTGFLEIGCGGCYGGGVLLRNVSSSIIRGNTLTDESTGLEMIGGRANSVYDNLLSRGPEGNERQQDSCWGIRLDGSTENLIRGNAADWVDRRRYGLDSGDSAGILLVAGSHGNRIISNSMTHSGDGFFLGNSCARASHGNYVYGNDGSFSPHNAFEATFSSGNVFQQNSANDSDYGFWLGYSYESRVTGNEIQRNASTGIAIEHGHGIEIDHDLLTGNPVGVALWAANDTCPSPDCGASCPSAGYDIHDNAITGNGSGLNISDTAGAAVSRNRLAANSDRNVRAAGRSTGVVLRRNDLSCRLLSARASSCVAVADEMTVGLDVAAIRNFWGAVDPAAIAGMILDQEDDAHLGRVTFQPFLTAAPVAVPLSFGCRDGELLTAPLSRGARGAMTRLTYQGQATIEIAGAGQVLGGAQGDAFYLYAQADGTPLTPPVHSTKPGSRILAIDHQPVDAWLDGGKVPPYQPDHRYRVRIRAPSGRLTFGVTARAATASSGQFTIGLCGGTP